MMQGAGQNGSDNNLLQKIRNQVSLPRCANLRFRMGVDRGLPFWRLLALERTDEKNFPAKKLRNALKSFDSGEEIQGNPRAHKRGLRSETASRQEDPNGSTGPILRPAAAARAAARTRPRNIDVSSADGEVALSRETSIAV
jgi:hypothetical protein